MTPDELKRKECLDVLELPADASPYEVRAAYQHLKDLYTKGSIAISPIEDDYPQEAKGDILQEIEEAYKWLATNQGSRGDGRASAISGSDSTVSSEVRAEMSTIESFDGSILKSIREQLGIELGEIEMATKISRQHIRSMEEDKYKSLPEPVYVRGYLIAYAKCLGLEPQKVANTYIEKFNRWKKTQG